MQFTHGRPTAERTDATWGITDTARTAVDGLLLDALLRSAPTMAGPAARVFTGGKRLRPGVTIAAAGHHDADLIAAPTLNGATAIELLHWATLVHDDVIDEASSRHGQPTVNACEGVGHAIVTGDLLIGAAFELAAQVGTDTVRCLARTLTDLCVGQTREDTHRFDPDTDEDDVVAVASGKTGSLLAAAARVGGHCAGSDPAETDALAEFGMAFGISLQLLDDVLDLVSSTDRLGKPVAADFANGTITLPAVVALRRNPELRDLLRPGLDRSERTRALSLLRDPDAVGHGLRQARHHAERAHSILATLADHRPELERLARWPVAYLDDQLKRKVVPALRPLLDGAREGRRIAV